MDNKLKILIIIAIIFIVVVTMNRKIKRNKAVEENVVDNSPSIIEEEQDQFWEFEEERKLEQLELEDEIEIEEEDDGIDISEIENSLKEKGIHKIEEIEH
ncbi:MAG: hypothetical protein IJ867_08405 [Clostridia bacterium]|nr:hypothetical protein [Clostridia bacterium]